MFTLILLLYLQQNLDVTLESSSLRGEFSSRADCEQAGARLRGALPTPEGHAAAWHDALCLPIARGVTVRASAPLALAALLQERPVPECGADGAWRRVAEACQSAADPSPQAGTPTAGALRAHPPISPSAPSSRP